MDYYGLYGIWVKYDLMLDSFQVCLLMDCGLLWCFYQLSFWRHPFTSIAETLMQRHTLISDDLRMSTFAEHLHFWLNYCSKHGPDVSSYWCSEDATGSNTAPVSKRQTQRATERRTDGCSSPLFGDDFILSVPGVLEIVAELVPQHEDVVWRNLLLSRLGFEPKVHHDVLETTRKHGVRERRDICSYETIQRSAFIWNRKLL